jgi:hypothetical protein
MANGVAARSATPRAKRARWARLALLAWSAATACCWLAAPAVAQTSVVEASERSVKAAFVYKFTQYVDWPADSAAANEPFTIGVFGSGAYVDELMRMTEDRSVSERLIRVRRVGDDDTVDDLQVLFVAGDQRGKVSELLATARGRPILTVTESEGALADGSIINFTRMGDRVRFEVSLPAAEANRLRLNSRLLAVAQAIRQAP